MNLQKSLAERLLHALIFEVLAIAICAPLGAWLLGHSMAHMGALSLMISSVAMSWNMVFNALFDKAQLRWGFQRHLKARIVHALLFEIGLMLALVPLVAWWLDMGLWQALLLDIGISLFFLPYSFVFNWVYDHLSARLAARKSRKQAQAKTQPPGKLRSRAS